MSARRLCNRILIIVLLTVGASAGAYAAELREETEFGSNPGNLRMFSYLPGKLKPSAPFIVVLHGCKQKAGTFATRCWMACACRRGRLALLIPEQKGLPSYFYDVYLFPWFVALWGANNQNACFNWFQPEDTARDRGEALSIRQMIDAMVARHSVDRWRVYVVGLSAGGAMAAVCSPYIPSASPVALSSPASPMAAPIGGSKALQCMNPGLDLTPDVWRARVREATKGERPQFRHLNLAWGGGHARSSA